MPVSQTGWQQLSPLPRILPTKLSPTLSLPPRVTAATTLTEG